MNETELIQGCKNMDAVAQHSLFKTYAGTLMTICRRYACDQSEAEDMLQESFINIFRNIRQYRGTGSFEGWLRKITVHVALRILKKRKISFIEVRSEGHELPSDDNHVFSDLEAEDLLKMISALPDGYRMVFNLYALEGYSHEEIAIALNIKTATSRSQLSKARNLLQQKIKSIYKTQHS